MTFRSREILNADTIVGQVRLQQQPDLELRGQSPPAAPSTPRPASTWRASCSATPAPRTATCSTRTPTPRSGRSGRSTCRTTSGVEQQADPEPGPALGRVRALGRDRRPAVELRRDDRHSSWWPPTTPTLDGVKVGRYLQTYSKGDLGPRFGFAYDVIGTGTHDRPRRRRGVLELHAGRHVVVQGPEPAVPPVDGAHRGAEHELLERPQDARLGRPAAAAGRRPDAAARRRAPRARSSTSTSATPTRSTGTSTSSTSSARTT